jgi:hypothetical protein
VRFPAYSDNEIFKAILTTPDNLAVVVGKGYSSEFHQMLIHSFLTALVQTMRGMTRDVRDMRRAGRYLWPLYVEPLNPQNIDLTMKALEGQDQPKALLSFLGKRMLKLSKNVEIMLLSLGCDSDPTTVTASALPYLSKCMILASFICQHNKADKDKQLFTNISNGTKRRQHEAEGDAETVAYGTWDQKRLRMLKPRSFPLERMLSIFVNIVGLHEGREHFLTKESMSSLVSRLGTTVSLETVGQLRAIGLLREIPSEDGISLSTTMYCCDMGKDHAESVARSIDFPLERYLV